NMNLLKFKTAVLFALAIFVFAANGQTPDKDDQPIKINTVLLNVPVIASDAHGRYVSGLKKENFSVIQDGQKQDIEFFADEKAPMNVVILIDCSGSTRPFLDSIKDAARDFVKIFRPEDQGMIVTFASEAKVMQEFTSDQKKLDKAIKKADLLMPSGSNMQDAMYDIVTRSFKGVQGRKAIIVLTDGFVTGQNVSDQLLINALAETDILVYPVMFNTKAVYNIPYLPDTVRFRDGTVMSREEAVKRIQDEINGQLRFMSALGPATGGKRIDATATDFKTAFQNVADELKNQYVIGFYPQLGSAGKISNIGLKVDQNEVQLRTKKAIKLKP
ncbi:MAG TPA: VWA domain-containing protein, partial [Pyrinomonadaceae bacterium]|nr:VWA domain-containing protein [Pyrinomonadaceae bacterium]